MDELVSEWMHFAPGVVRVPITAFKYRRKIQKCYKKLQVFIGTGKTNILVTGLPFSGKTVLSSAITDQINLLTWQRPKGSRDVETKTIDVGDRTRIVRVIPGQGYSEREKGLHEALAMHDELEGVIHVVDWGFNKTRDAAVEQKEIEEGIDNIEKLRERNLIDELKEFEAVCSRIKSAHALKKGPKWLVIAVNKCDLYKSDLQKAREYYHPAMKSDFTKVINALLHDIGKAHLNVISLPICSYEENFEWGGNVVYTNLGGTDQKSSLLKNFIDQLAMLG